MKQASDCRLEVVERFFAGTGASYDRVVHYATLGIDRQWKHRIVSLIPPHAARILDLACGTGLLTFAIARRFPRAHVIGVEVREEYLALAREKQEQQGLRNVELILSRAEEFSSDVPFDCIVSSYLAKYADLASLTTSIETMLRVEGLLLMHDFILPPKPYLRVIWRWYFWMLQRLAAPLLPAWRAIFYGLPQLIEQSRWVNELTDELVGRAFQGIRVEYLTFYGSGIVIARAPGHSSEQPPKLSPTG